MTEKITIRLPGEMAAWVREEAARKRTSVSRLVRGVLERQMLQTDEYWLAYLRWTAELPVAQVSAAQRMSREEVHERR